MEETIKIKQPGRWLAWWEDQHPLMRYSVGLLIFQIGMWLILNAATYLAPRFFSYAKIFDFIIVERLGTIISLILVAIVLFNTFRIFMRYLNKAVSMTSVGLTILTGLLLVGFAMNMPSFLKGTIGHQMGARFPRVFGDFRELCDEWEETYGQQATIAIRPAELDTGIFNDTEKVELYRLGSGDSATVIFQMGDEEQIFGLACVLGSGETPYNSGRTSDFDYVHWGNNYYGFVENKDE